MIKNPILPGFHSDPSIIRVGDMYYLATSSFEWFPGIPIYRSNDLKNWQLISHALTRKEQAELRGVSSANGVWAPALSYDEQTQTFYIAFSIVWGFDNNNFDADNFLVTTKDIEKEWSDPIYVNSSGFDPSLFHDTNGKSFLVNLEWEFREGYTHPGSIIIQEYDKKNKKLIGDIKSISRGATKRGCIEGPHLYKKDNYYYLITAEGGTGYGHCVAISRSSSVCGPYKPYPHNPLLTSYEENFDELGNPNSAKPWRYAEGQYLQKSGHGSLVETPQGEVYMVHLCSRPITKDNRSVLGRETAIQKCIWTEEHWLQLEQGGILVSKYTKEPKIDENITKLESYPPLHGILRDDFSDGKIPLHYYTTREPIKNTWANITADNQLELYGRGTLFGKYGQSILARKVTGFSYTTKTKINAHPKSFLQMAGITHFYNNNNFYYLRIYFSETLGQRALGIIESNQGQKKEFTESRIALKDNQWIYLKGVVQQEKLQYYYSYDNNNWEKIEPVLDISILSDEYAGGFTGSLVGMTAQDLQNHTWSCLFDFFEYENTATERE